jgi:hypothetical protein
MSPPKIERIKLVFEEFSTADNGYYARHGGKRRLRKTDSTDLSERSDWELALNANTSNPTYQRKSTPYTVSGHAKATLDQNNSGIRALNRLSAKTGRGRIDEGGPFLSENMYVTDPVYVDSVWSVGSFGGRRETVKGYFHADNRMAVNVSNIANGTFTSPLEATEDGQLLGLGSTAIARTLPTKPEMSLSTSVAELKDGLPSLIGRQMVKNPSLSAAGGEYLNYQFGIAPMVTDASSVVSLTKQYEKILTQFRRDNGKIVRRRITLVDEEEKTLTKGTGYAYSGGSGNQTSMLYSTAVHGETKSTRRVWFSGAYKLAYPLSLDDSLKGITEFNRVYGVIPTPELAWELLPFSWLADWFTNVGDVVSNASTLGSSLQLSYGYIMAEDTWSREASGEFGPTDYYVRNGTSSRIAIKSQVVHTRKRRLKATPFGFSTSFSTLSMSQKAILTALGLSRLKM